MSMISLASVALALGLSHEATEADVLAGIGKVKTDAEKKAEAEKKAADAEATRKELNDVLEAIGGKTAPESIGKLEAERSSHEELVKAVVGEVVPVEGQAAVKPTARDAIAKISADRKSSEKSRASTLIEQAIAAGKVPANGEKALALYEKHGMAALEAHIDALVPHTAIVAPAPTQKPPTPGAGPTTAKKDGEFVLSADDEKMIENYGMDRDKFIATRKQAEADSAKAAARRAAGIED